MALEIYDNETAQTNSKARILLLGPAKAGKTTCVAKTAPLPLILNCDGRSATKGASNQGAQFKALDVSNRRSWLEGCKLAAELAKKGDIKTVMVDTVSLLSDVLFDEIDNSGVKGWDRFTELNKLVIEGLRILFAADAHLFVISHFTPDYDASAGVLPAIPGKLKIRLPALLDDWIMLECDATSGKRNFLLGPQKNWTASGRNIKRSCVIEADVIKLFKELGINP